MSFLNSIIRLILSPSVNIFNQIQFITTSVTISIHLDNTQFGSLIKQLLNFFSHAAPFSSRRDTCFPLKKKTP